MPKHLSSDEKEVVLEEIARFREYLIEGNSNRRPGANSARDGAWQTVVDRARDRLGNSEITVTRCQRILRDSLATVKQYSVDERRYRGATGGGRSLDVEKNLENRFDALFPAEKEMIGLYGKTAAFCGITPYGESVVPLCQEKMPKEAIRKQRTRPLQDEHSLDAVENSGTSTLALNSQNHFLGSAATRQRKRTWEDDDMFPAIEEHVESSLARSQMNLLGNTRKQRRRTLDDHEDLCGGDDEMESSLAGSQKNTLRKKRTFSLEDDNVFPAGDLESGWMADNEGFHEPGVTDSSSHNPRRTAASERMVREKTFEMLEAQRKAAVATQSLAKDASVYLRTASATVREMGRDFKRSLRMERESFIQSMNTIVSSLALRNFSSIADTSQSVVNDQQASHDNTVLFNREVKQEVIVPHQPAEDVDSFVDVERMSSVSDMLELQNGKRNASEKAPSSRSPLL